MTNTGPIGEFVAVAERHWLPTGLSPILTVLAPEILEDRVALANHDSRVTPGISPETSSRIVAAGSRPMMFSPATNTMRRVPATIHRLTSVDRIGPRSTGAAHVADSVRRTDDRRLGVASAQCPTKFFHESHERPVRHERSRPESLVQFGLSYHARRFVCQQGQQVERFGRQMDLDLIARELPGGFAVEGDAPRRSPESPEFLLNLSRDAPDLRGH
jgi:hypothetical protein